jgi:hypothetical protein
MIGRPYAPVTACHRGFSAARIARTGGCALRHFPLQIAGGSTIADRNQSSRQMKLTNVLHLRHWRIGVLVCFLVAMSITPADPMRLLVVAVPLVCVYLLVAFIATRMQ